MISLQDASIRLQLPVETIWQWISDGRIEAVHRPGRGPGMEYLLNPVEFNKACALREGEYAMSDEPQHVDSKFAAADNVITYNFGDIALRQSTPQTGSRTDAVVAIENLRSEAISAVHRQAGREKAISEMVAAIETVIISMLEAMERSQDLNDGRLTAEVETLRARLARQIQEREREDTRLRDELVVARTELTAALKALNPVLDLQTQPGPLAQESSVPGHQNGKPQKI